MSQPFLALITPLPAGVGPSHPIAPGGQPPLGIWGGGGVGNYPDAGFPGPQPGAPGQPTHPIYNPPYPSQGPGFPTNPIAPGGPPPGIWGGGGVGNYPDAGFPAPQPPPGQPTHPIAPGGQPGQPPQEGQGGWVFSPYYGWVWEPAGSGGKPRPPSLPGAGRHPDQSLPGAQPHPDQGLPGAQPHPDQSLPQPMPSPVKPA